MKKAKLIIEMTIKLPSIQFTEPTLIAFTGANFPAFVDGKKIAPYKIHLMDKGEVLKFGGSFKRYERLFSNCRWYCC
ncbi:hypothetical protein NIT60_01775 [Mammaliicoccus sciuri]|nr:hypothetical protein NIT60_01775 [Mammaliicoccus sciuri]